MLAGVEDNNNNNIEENSLSDEEDSVPDVLYEEEPDSDSEPEKEEEIFLPGVKDDKHWFQGSYLLQMEIPFQSHCADQEESLCREPH